MAHALSFYRISSQVYHCAPKRIRVVWGNNKSSFSMNVNKRGTSSNLARDQRLSEHRPLDQRYAERFRSKVRGKN
ncbi:hypothetical protein ACVMGC_012029, partial [Bradyrhizobium barranii subsp. barranii]